MRYDVIIVGAGSAGCVLADRLSEDANRSVLLLEAGPDYAREADLPAEIRDGFNPVFTHDWGYVSEPGAPGRQISFSRAKLVGGCSATNAAFALRGAPQDYDEWAERGNPGWSFSEVIPFFRRLENDTDVDDDWHGRNGPLSIRRYRDDEMLPEHDTFLRACWNAGYARVPDHNAPGALGAGPVPTNTIAGVRQSTALTYLARARHRRNLHIRANVAVDRVEFAGRCAIGVRIQDSAETINTDHVVLAAGTYASPAILMRSGVGPEDQLAQLGIDVIEHLPGVGKGLSDHPLFKLRFAVPPPHRTKSVPGCQSVLTLKSAASVVAHDLQIFPWTASDVEVSDSPSGGALSLYVGLMKPLSTGHVRLRSRDPAAAPIIDHNYFSDSRDMPRMLAGVRAARALVRMSPLSDYIIEPLYPAHAAFDADAKLEAAIGAQAGTYFHPIGTCRMGPSSDPYAVVDARGRVHGLTGLSVIDASIMPTIPAANSNLSTLMLAERCAAWMTE